MSPLTSSRHYCGYLELLSKPCLLPLLTVLDLMSLVSRNLIAQVFPLLFLKMHEHINFFSELALSRLCEKLGVGTLAVRSELQAGLLTQQGVIRLIGCVKGLDSACDL